VDSLTRVAQRAAKRAASQRRVAWLGLPTTDGFFGGLMRGRGGVYSVPLHEESCAMNGTELQCRSRIAREPALG
jgi:hypothetical protein